MATAATSLLGLALPVTGELSGTWGDTVNVSITALLDTAVAGTTTLSSDADVTLTTTTLAANQARQAIILWTAGGTVTRTITVPAQSKSYIVINKTSSSQSIKIVGAGPTTGVTIVAGTAAFVVWNGVDFVTASVTSTTGVLPVANGGTGLSSGTSGGVLAYTATGTLASSTALAANALVIGGGAGAAPSTTTTGTGVVTALGVNVGTAGAFVVNGGALGSPSSVGTMPAFTLGGTVSGGGNNINNVVIGASSPLAGNFTTLTTSSTVTINGGTANGVAYLDGSKVLTTGSALTFDGTYFTVGASSTTGDYKAFIQKAGGELLGLNASSGTLARIAFGNATASFGSTQIIANAADLAFITNSAEQMRLTSTGLGIGATSLAGMKLVALGATGYPATSGTTQTGVLRVTGGTGLYNVLDMGVNESTDTSWIQATRANNLAVYDKLVINPYGGNVGIGTSSPATELQVSANEPKLRITSTAASGKSWDISSGGNTTVTLGHFCIYDTATDAQRFNIVSGNGQMLLDGSGNLGLGVTPSAWGSLIALDISSYGSVFGFSNQAGLTGNCYYNGSSWVYKATAAATQYQQISGQHIWHNAASGSGTFNFTQAMTLDASGNLGVGPTSPTVKLDVQAVAVSATSDATALRLYQTGDGGVAMLFTNGVSNLVRLSGTVTSAGGGTDDGVFTIQTASNGTLAERARFNSTGALVFAGGTTTADGIGITFPATQSASSNANTLDDYEQGTWTPTIVGGTTAGTTTYVSQFGDYVKIGRSVTARFKVNYSAATGTGFLSIVGLPFPGASGESIGSVMIDLLNAPNSGSYSLYNSGTTSTLEIYSSTDDAALTIFQLSNEAATIWGTITYFAAD